ncbi:MAG: DinB family protein [Bryobacteraceae bacterium]
MVRTEFVLDSWKAVRRDTAQALLDMPADQLDFRPSPDLMTFREIAVHILNAGHALAAMLLDGVDDMTGADFRSRMRTYFFEGAEAMGAGELSGLLERAIEDDCRALGERGSEFHAGMITKFDGTKLTRLEMVQFTKEHEMTHRSQMFLYLRLQGVVAPTSRPRMGKKNGWGGKNQLQSPLGFV